MAEKAKAKYVATVSMKVIRADGTEEDLGVVEVAKADADRVAALIAELRPDEASGEVTLDEANARIAEESKRNAVETERLNAEAGEE